MLFSTADEVDELDRHSAGHGLHAGGEATEGEDAVPRPQWRQQGAHRVCMNTGCYTVQRVALGISY